MEEFSAGGIVIKRGKISSVIPAKAGIQEKNGSRVKPGMTYILVSQHSGHHGWVFPKGHVGDTIPGETPQEAAIREVQEETGITGEITKVLPTTEYWYVFQGQKRHKTIQYYLMDYVSGDIKNHGWEMEDVAWLPIEEVEKRLTYDGDKKVWEKAKKLLES